jgi:hypothetical protein
MFLFFSHIFSSSSITSGPKVELAVDSKPTPAGFFMGDGYNDAYLFDSTALGALIPR